MSRVFFPPIEAAVRHVIAVIWFFSPLHFWQLPLTSHWIFCVLHFKLVQDTPCLIILPIRSISIVNLHSLNFTVVIITGCTVFLSGYDSHQYKLLYSLLRLWGKPCQENRNSNWFPLLSSLVSGSLTGATTTRAAGNNKREQMIGSKKSSEDHVWMHYNQDN